VILIVSRISGRRFQFTSSWESVSEWYGFQRSDRGITALPLPPGQKQSLVVEGAWVMSVFSLISKKIDAMLSCKMHD
jgi:hypothetical protein